MRGLLQRRLSLDSAPKSSSRNSDKDPLRALSRLGSREREVLEVLWADGSATVHQVVSQLGTTLAYTTVMTILDRLFKKGFLLREKHDRAFVYRAALAPVELESVRATVLVDEFFSGSSAPNSLLLSCLFDAMRRYDNNLLQEFDGKDRSTQ
jgi:predicted transcriptional regulator